MTNICTETHKIRTVRVLIVEDEYILAINLQESLELLGYTVVDIADSAELAIEKSTQLLPNLILMDIRLRGEKDGIQAAEQIWHNLQIPIIYVTGHSDQSTVERATLTFPFGYILKPVREQELYVAIQTALNRYEREQFLSSVLRGMGDGVIVVDTQLRVKYMNQIAEALTGWRFNDAKDQNLTDVLRLIDEQSLHSIQNPMISAIEKETTVYLGDRILLVTKDGTMIPVADSATPLRNNNGEITGAVMVFRDDTQRRLLEERNLAAERNRQLEIQMAEMQRFNQLKEDFLTATSYEMRTPLSNIKMAISMLENVINQQDILQSTVPPVSVSIGRYLGIIRHECERELNLVDDLLNMRIMDTETYPLELVPIHLQSWLPEIVKDFQEIAQAHKQALEVNIADNLPALFSDVNILARIVSELLLNACRYTPPHERITVTVHFYQKSKSFKTQDTQSDLSSVASSSYFQIRINNSGVEIPLAEQSQIFEPFYRIVPKKTTEKLSVFEQSYQLPMIDYAPSSDTGLGLTLVKKLVQYIQGTIEVTSSHNLTTFTVQLPLSLSIVKK
ncbi:hybrid sensor histidine kinase/response regulator [Anabaena azotica]|uniref:histidine kinase n=1 Tax=Anabaena azotica FACHB-119 TaxID=947527 RepID=A0ABR8D813_9NOST|nr:response regulator [Anabaena azotica]MBD2503328.1 response regulator [Anabaena azotica FACHB-119]